MKEYNSCLHLMYNYIVGQTEDISLFSLGKSDSHLTSYIKSQNNIDKISCDSWFRVSCLGEAYSMAQRAKAQGRSCVFGGRKLFLKRMKGQVFKEEFKLRRLLPICSAGDKLHDRKFKLEQDLETVTFKPTLRTKIQLKLHGIGPRHQTLQKLYLGHLNHLLPITYKLDLEYVYICFDESLLYAKDFKVNALEGRVMAIDMNPNYVGWSIVDWKSSSEFNIIKSGVFSIKQLNDKEYNFKKQNLASNSKQRIWLSNKRRVETLEISKALVNIALHYRCQLFIVEELNIKPSDKGIGKNFNRLCNNNWNRNMLINNLRKRCNIFGIKLLEVKPEYSSFIGNFIFRSVDTKLPDMALASIEIGRRGFEFYGQYISKKLKIQKNIVQPNRNDFKRLIDKSLEEFALKDKDHLSLVELYFFIKNSKIMYRVPIESCLTNSIVLRQFPKQSLVSHYKF